jgi:hypothetical protein
VKWPSLKAGKPAAVKPMHGSSRATGSGFSTGPLFQLAGNFLTIDSERRRQDEASAYPSSEHITKTGYLKEIRE